MNGWVEEKEGIGVSFAAVGVDWVGGWVGGWGETYRGEDGQDRGKGFGCEEECPVGVCSFLLLLLLLLLLLFLLCRLNACVWRGQRCVGGRERRGGGHGHWWTA